MANTKTNYEDAKKRGDELEIEMKRTAAVLKNLSGGGAMGLTPDRVKATPVWRKAKKDYDVAFKALRDFNGDFARRFWKEIREERNSRRKGSNP